MSTTKQAPKGASTLKYASERDVRREASKVLLPPERPAAAKANACAFVLQAGNAALIAKARSVHPAVAVNLDAWLKSGMRYCVLAFERKGRDRLVMAANAEGLTLGLEAIFDHLQGTRCVWTFDEALRATVEPLLVANEMGEAAGGVQ